MRIHHVLPYDLRQPGGVQTHTLALSDALERLGHDSQVFAPTRPLRVRLGGSRADLTWHPADLWRLRSFLQQPHDILHVQEPMLPLLGPLSLLHPDDAPVVVTLHSAESLARRFYRATRPLSRLLLGRADAIICASDVSHAVAEDALPTAPHLIPPCLDLAPFLSVQPASDSDTILFIGRDEPRKGLRVLLAAMRRLPDLRLVVAGPVRESTRRAADSRATFLGSVPHEQIPELMASAACAVFPATGGEALGLVLVEAMAAGVPVIASDIPGYRIATDDGASALLVPPDDPVVLADRIRELMHRVDLRGDLAARGRETAKRFAASTIAEQHLELYLSLTRP
ncbi:MAG: glycosyltransferase family 4 protein [Chloroflexi bacterium]|nr:glycosyltransferase family 4 protein [Chloroflexota bacterium]MYF22001.1 glycosyltransferase family 4 protein [Chloroflexota bacterium]